MRRMTFVATLVLVACSGVEEAARDVAASVSDLTVRQVGELAGRILDDPARAEELLEASGLSLDQLDSIVYDIAADPEASEEYLRALGDLGGSSPSP